MSLINKMLSGLDERGVITAEEDRDPALDELSPVEEELMPRRREGAAGWLFILGLAAAVMLLVYLYSGGGLSSRVYDPPTAGRGVPAGGQPEAVASHIEPTTETPVGAVNGRPDSESLLSNEITLKLDDGLNASPGTDPAHGPASGSGTIRIQQIRMQSESGVLAIDVLLPEDTRYAVYTLQGPHRLVLELSDARYAGALPDIAALPGIRAIRQNMRHDGKYVLVLEGQGAFEIEGSELAQTQEGYRLQLLAATAVPGPVVPGPAAVAAEDGGPDISQPGSFTKSPSVPVSGIRKRKGHPASPVEALLYQGRQLYDEGNVNQGLEKILSAVEREPGHVMARSTLAILLLDQGRNDMAKEVLARGLRQKPDTSQWAMILARTLYTDGSLEQARMVLEEAAPAAADDPDYHGLYAGILQAQGEHARAVVVYQNLLEQHGDKGAWWLGLGISLEAMARKADAIIAYRNALNNSGIEGDSRDYIRDRLTDLEQQT